MTTQPLSPSEVDRLLRPDARTAIADLRALRDSLLRMGYAFERLARSAERLQRSARTLQELARGHRTA